MRVLIVSVIAVICIAGVVLSNRQTEPPLPVVASRESLVEPSQCEDCHSDIVERFRAAPHSKTLRPATDPEMIAKFAGKNITLDGELYSFVLEQGKLKFSSGSTVDDVLVDWVFGSGHHALTPAATLENPRGETEMLQTYASWYPGDELDKTLGTESADNTMGALGIHHSLAQTLECFGCHSSAVPEDNGRIDFSQVHAGISCSRCHPGAGAHALAEGDISTGVSWSELSPLEAINRCGECHRRADEIVDEISPESKLLVRLAPVGLSQSACFQQTVPTPPGTAPRRLDCVFCHDPHEPASTDPQFYVERCLDCHSSRPADAPDCSPNR